VRRVASGETSAVEVIEAHLQRIELVNSKVNGIVNALEDPSLKAQPHLTVAAFPMAEAAAHCCLPTARDDARFLLIRPVVERSPAALI